MGVVIDEVVTEIDAPPTGGNSQGEHRPAEGTPQAHGDGDLRRRLERLCERQRRLAAD